MPSTQLPSQGAGQTRIGAFEYGQDDVRTFLLTDFENSQYTKRKTLYDKG